MATTGGVAAVLTLAAPGATGSLSFANALIVDGTAPGAPAITLDAAHSDPTNDNPVTFNVDFGEDINQSTFVVGDVTASSGTVQNISDTGDGQNFDFEVLGATDNTALTVQIASGAVDDLAGNSTTAISNLFSVDVDRTAPTMDSAVTTSTTTVDVTFSESIDDSTVHNTGDFTVGGVATTDAVASGSTVTLTVLTPFATDALPAIVLTSAQGGVDDAVGNTLASDAGFAATDGVAPTMDSAVTTSTTTVDVTFSESIDDSTVADVGDFTVGGVATTNAVASGDTVTLTIGTPFATDATPTIVLTAAQGGVDDAFGNTLASDAGFAATDGVAPTISVTSVSPVSGNTATIGDNVIVTLTAGGAEIGLVASGIQTINGVPSVFAESGLGVYTVTYTIIDGNADILDSAALPINIEFEDATGLHSNILTSIDAGTAPGIDANLPFVVSASANTSQTITLTMSEDVINNAATPSEFTTSGIASNPTVDSISVSGNKITLELTGGEITSNDSAIKVSYTPIIGSIDDLAGNSLSDFRYFCN